MHHRRLRNLWWMLLIVALALRLIRVVLRWDEIALAYAAYQAPVVDALLHPARLVGTFVGLHPPLYGVIFAVMEKLLPAPLVFLLFSALCSWGAVWFVGRAARTLGGPWAMLGAGALAATAPVALHYAAEVNDYSLLLLLVAGLLWIWTRYRAGRCGWGAVASLAVAAVWTHILGGVVVGCVVLLMLWDHRGDGLKTFLTVALASLPVVAAAVLLAGDAHTFGQPPVLLLQSLHDWRERFGALVIPLGVLALPALRRATWVGFCWFGLAASISALVFVGVAAPHQFPYWSLLMPMATLLAGLTGARSVRWRLAVGALVLAQLGVAVREDAGKLSVLTRDQRRERAIDVALGGARAGDALWLISPALQPDDDKRAISPVLWRLRPWRLQPMVRPFPFDYTDYRFGQPRRYGAWDVYTFTDFWPARMDAILDHYTHQHRWVWIALYDHGPARDYPARLRKVLRPWSYREREVGADWGLGVDRLLVVTGVVDAAPRLQAAP